MEPFPPAPATQLAIQDTLFTLFVETDRRNWEVVRDCFDETVRLDYSSMGAGEPQTMTAQQVIDSWRSFLPGFETTHHQIGNCQVRLEGWRAQASCYGTASHFLRNPSGLHVWTVVGAYEFELQPAHGRWCITRMTFHFKFQDGNLHLPDLARSAAAAHA